MAKLALFSVFHLNLSYSCIEEEWRKTVIKSCYWPILETAEQDEIPIAIELSGSTLVLINALDPEWVIRLKKLLKERRCELIGSAYSQAIGPLLPKELNEANINHGMQIYEELLGILPTIALVNEQAFSSGLIKLYKEAGYRALIMEWNNVGSLNRHWPSEYRYHPQLVSDGQGNELPVIWSDSIGFQQFQRYIHRETKEQQYLEFLRGLVAELPRCFSLYSNDAEIFDYRPRRYNTEPTLQQRDEWQRITQLLRDIKQREDFNLVAPSILIEKEKTTNNFNALSLGSAMMPVPVKKQGKYNLLRWANSGRDDLDINTRCWRIYRAIKNRPLDDAIWRRLCALWGSDYRTHITEERWRDYLTELSEFEQELGINTCPQALSSDNNIVSASRYLELSKDDARIIVDSQRGLNIRECCLGKETASMFGVIPHATFHDIRFAADWYSGHMTYEAGGQHKITDLTPVAITQHNSERISAQVDIQNFGRVHKTIQLISDNSLSLKYCFDVTPQYDGIWRCCYLTINPDVFDQKTLFYATHNGGEVLETFPIVDEFDHGRAISSLVSATTALGATEGMIQIGDRTRHLEISFDQAQLALIPMLSFDKVDDSYLLRFWFSLRELDDTRRFEMGKHHQYEFDIHIKLVD